MKGTCESCQEIYEGNSIPSNCGNCGGALVIEGNSNVEEQKQENKEAEASLSLLTTVDGIQISIPICFNGNEAKIIGRFSANGKPDVDLTGLGEGISRKHCIITKDNEMYYLQDSNSANGTIVNGTRLNTENKVELKNGDLLVIGNVKLVVNIK